MKLLSPVFLLLGLALLAGCSNRYTITLNNGTQMGAQGKPVLKGGSYFFKDASGQEASVAAGRVSVIEPESSVKRSSKPGYIQSQGYIK
ncbi:MAG: YgdI/YgdR family lipoprotein [Verrucomicrobiota bacterium]